MQDFSDLRLLNILDQNFSFSPSIVSDAMQEIQKRKLLSAVEMSTRFEAGLKKGIEIQQKEKLERQLAFEKEKKRQQTTKRIYLLIMISTLIGSVVMWYYTKSIFILALAPATTAGIAMRERKTLFDK